MNINVSNRFNIPGPFMQMISRNTYTQGKTDVNVTSFLAPPQIGALKSLHADKIVVDASDQLYSAWGNNLHNILENYGHTTTDAIVEEFLFTQDKGIKWGGHIDLREPSPNGFIISDYKVAPTFKVKKILQMDGDRDKEWEKQLNCYALLVKRNNPDIKIFSIQVVAFLRDWSKVKAADSNSYPQCGVAVVNLPLWTVAEQEIFVRDRLDLWAIQQQALDQHGDFIPCTPEERWKKADVFKVKDKKTHRSKRNFDNEKDAQTFIKSQAVSEKFYIEASPGLSLRCTHYCEVAPYCKQFKEEGEKK